MSLSLLVSLHKIRVLLMHKNRRGNKASIDDIRGASGTWFVLDVLLTTLENTRSSPTLNTYTSRNMKQLNNSFIFPDAVLKNVEIGFNIFDVVLMASKTMKLLFVCFTFLTLCMGTSKIWKPVSTWSLATLI